MKTNNTYLKLTVHVVLGDFSLKCVLIELTIPNLSLIYFCISEIFKSSI